MHHKIEIAANVALSSGGINVASYDTQDSNTNWRYLEKDRLNGS